MITKLYIKNFRSIESASIDCSDINTFVGRNDAGKSNIIRALNLFFNGYTDHDTKFDFDKDYNYFSRVGKNKAKEITIEITVRLPGSYCRQGYPEEVSWRKIWRTFGELESAGFRRYVDGKSFPPRSKVSSLLDRIVFNYVPAIKDKSFFADLQGQVYDVLASVAEDMLRQSATNFEAQIQEHLKELLQYVTKTFSKDSMIKLPRNLRDIFESLEFDSDGIPLSQRGDGIKVRHIPMMLKFMAEKRNSIHKGGICPHIWGIEEPENNIELNACFELANDFIKTSEEHQLFISTHSPVFYNLSNKTKTRSYFVSKEDRASRISPVDIAKINFDMGLMPIIAPFVDSERIEWEKRTSELKQNYDKLVADADNKPQLFVEGATDKAIFEKLLSVLFVDYHDKIKVNCGENSGYGSANAAASRAIAWQLVQQHQATPLKGAVIFDNDDAGNAGKLYFEKNMSGSGSRHVKALILNPGNVLGQLKKDGFLFPVDLEALFPDWLWQYSQKQGWLEPVSEISERLNAEKTSKLFQDAVSGRPCDPFSGLSEVNKLRITMKFSQEGKQRVARYVCTLDEVKLREIALAFERTLAEALKFLFPQA